MDDNHKKPQTIETEIEKTRQRMSETLDEINDRLSPNQLLDRALEYFSDKILKSKINTASLTETTKKNPVATTLIGLGVGWLIVSGRPAETQDKSVVNHENSNVNAKNSKEETSQQNDSQEEHSLHKLHEQPLVLIGVGLAFGAALGVYLNSTQHDKKPFKQNLKKQIDQATETGNDQLEKMKEAVSTAVETISQAVDEVSNTTEADKDNNTQNNSAN